MTPECVPESAREGRQRLVEGLDGRGDKMRLKGPWTATSKPLSKTESEGLSWLAGRWGVGVDVSIIRPFRYSN